MIQLRYNGGFEDLINETRIREILKNFLNKPSLNFIFSKLVVFFQYFPVVALAINSKSTYIFTTQSTWARMHNVLHILSRLLLLKYDANSIR